MYVQIFVARWWCSCMSCLVVRLFPALVQSWREVRCSATEYEAQHAKHCSHEQRKQSGECTWRAPAKCVRIDYVCKHCYACGRCWNVYPRTEVQMRRAKLIVRFRARARRWMSDVYLSERRHAHRARKWATCMCARAHVSSSTTIQCDHYALAYSTTCAPECTWIDASAVLQVWVHVDTVVFAPLERACKCARLCAHSSIVRACAYACVGVVWICASCVHVLRWGARACVRWRAY